MPNAGQTPETPSRADINACIDASGPDAARLAQCGKVLSNLQTSDPDYGALAIALMQAHADAGRRGDALRYGDMLAASKTGPDVLITTCVVRVIVKWDLQTALKICRDAGPTNAAALEARGQINLLAGNWKDPSGQGHCRRGGCAVPVHQRLRFRRDVRRRRGLPGPGPLQPGEKACPLYHLYR